MNIKIEAEITEADLMILALRKGRTEKTTKYETTKEPALDEDGEPILDEDGEPTTNTVDALVEVKSKEPKLFIEDLYSEVIITDAVKIFTEYRTQELREQIKQIEEAVKESVTLSFI
jgi:hypothetical protein